MTEEPKQSLNKRKEININEEEIKVDEQSNDDIPEINDNHNDNNDEDEMEMKSMTIKKLKQMKQSHHLLKRDNKLKLMK